MRVVLILLILTYILVLGYLFVDRMGRCFDPQATLAVHKRRRACFLPGNREQDAAVRERIQRFHQDHRKMKALLYNTEISELPSFAD